MNTTTLIRNQMVGESRYAGSNPALSAIFATFRRIGTAHRSEFFQLRKRKYFYSAQPSKCSGGAAGIPDSVVQIRGNLKLRTSALLLSYQQRKE